jgi:hypothetical protein
LSPLTLCLIEIKVRTAAVCSLNRPGRVLRIGNANDSPDAGRSYALRRAARIAQPAKDYAESVLCEMRRLALGRPGRAGSEFSSEPGAN